MSSRRVFPTARPTEYANNAPKPKQTLLPNSFLHDSLLAAQARETLRSVPQGVEGVGLREKTNDVNSSGLV